jgi:hypothetical protein
MIYTVKDVVDRKTSGKWKFSKVVLTDGDKDYNVTLFDLTVQAGDKVDGMMGEFNSQYNNYKFKLNKIIPSTNTPTYANKVMTDDKRQSNIAFESFFASACNLLQGTGETGEAIAIAWQLHNYLTTGEWVMMSTPEQRKSIVAQLGGIEIARNLVFEQFHKPYLHLLTHEEAQEVLANA